MVTRSFSLHRSFVHHVFVPAVVLLTSPLIAHAAAGSGYLGIGFSVDPDSGVLTVEQVLPGSPAEHAGVEVADEVVMIGHVESRFPSHRAALDTFADMARVRVPLVLTIRRGAVTLEKKVIPSDFPASLAARNERALQCADGGRADEAWSRAFDAVP